MYSSHPAVHHKTRGAEGEKIFRGGGTSWLPGGKCMEATSIDFPQRVFDFDAVKIDRIRSRFSGDYARLSY